VICESNKQPGDGFKAWLDGTGNWHLGMSLHLLLSKEISKRARAMMSEPLMPAALPTFGHVQSRPGCASCLERLIPALAQTLTLAHVLQGHVSGCSACRSRKPARKRVHRCAAAVGRNGP